MLECSGKLRDSRITIFGFFLQSTQEHVINGSRKTRVEYTWWLGLVFHMLAYHYRWRTFKWGVAHQEFISHDGKSILVAGIGRPPMQLFRWHVCQGPQALGATASAHHAELRNAKISQEQVRPVWVFTGIDEEIRGLDIAVNDLFVMRVLKSISSLLHKIHHVLHWQ